MLFWLQEFLREHAVKVPMVFSYYSTRMILAAVTSLLISITFGPLFIRLLSGISQGQSIRTKDCPEVAKQHEGKQDTPTMGGLLIVLSLLFSSFLWMDLSHIFTLILFSTTLLFTAVGAFDDYAKLTKKSSKGVPARVKLFVQVIVGLFVALYFLVPSISQFLQSGNWFHPPVIKQVTASSTEVVSLQDYISRIYVPFFKIHFIHFGGIIISLWIIFLVTGASNAVNLTDGLDGLATGALLFSVIPFIFIAFFSNNIEIARYLNILYIEGSGEIAIFLSALFGACIGFLWYNGYPAQIFMGDTGSLTLGGLLGISTILLRKELLLAIAGGIFVIEALSVIIQVLSYRYRGKKRIFLCTPIHHHFQYKGMPEPKIVLRFWIIGLLLAIVAIASLKFQ